MIFKRQKDETDEQLICRVCSNKDSIGTWEDVCNILNTLLDKNCSESKYRKWYKIYQCGLKDGQNQNTSEIEADIQSKINELKKERIKLQTLNIERNKINRAEARQELFYEQVGAYIQSLPPVDSYDFDTDVEEFKEFVRYTQNQEDFETKYIVAISDIHAGANFKVNNGLLIENEYCMDIIADRFSFLLDSLIKFVIERNLKSIIVLNCGDTLQGLIHMNDLRINESTVVKTTVDISRMIASFLNKLSKYTKVYYYHVTSSNHTQLRPLNTKASELANEDLEYIIGHYIDDLCEHNEKVEIILPEFDAPYVKIDINIDNQKEIDTRSFDIYAMHGHQIKDINQSIEKLSLFVDGNVDYYICGHFHSSTENTISMGCTYDKEVLICPSFMGADPFSSSIFKGCHGAVKIFGFNNVYGHIETHKIIVD